MNVWLWASAGLLLSLAICAIACFRGECGDRLAGLEMASVVLIMDLVVLAQGYGQSAFFDLALTLTILCLGGALVFARFLEKWI